VSGWAKIVSTPKASWEPLGPGKTATITNTSITIITAITTNTTDHGDKDNKYEHGGGSGASSSSRILSSSLGVVGVG
jgi:hypothetical protein